MSIWHNDIVFPDDKRYWLAFINVRSNGNTFWNVSCHLADFIEDVSGAGFKVCNTKIEKWCYLDDLFNQQAEINRLRRVLKNIIECAPACYNTDECPLKNGDGFDNGCGYNCAYFLAHEALDAEKEMKKALQPSEAEQC